MSSPRSDSDREKPSSLERSMEIFGRLTNLYMEWNRTLFLSTFTPASDTPEYWEEMHKKMAQSIVENIKSAKGCWVKLGQLISTKPGLLPSCYLEAFSQLQDRMDHSDFSEIIDIIETDLGYMDDLFRNFDTIPVASASIAQVHKATLMNGTRVAVKVQHMSSEQNLKNDLEVLKIITRLIGMSGNFQYMYDYIAEYARSAELELDFDIELDNLKNAYRDAIESKVPVFVPKAYEEYCTKRIITMQYFDLHKLIDYDFMIENGVDRWGLVYDVYDFSLYQSLMYGRIHGDPHPGNIQVAMCPKRKRYVPVFLDWGLTLFLGNRPRIGSCYMYMAMYMGDTIGCVEGFLQIGFDLLDCDHFEYDRFLESLIPLYFHKNKNLMAMMSKQPEEEEKLKGTKLNFQQRTNFFLNEFLVRSPTFIPIVLKAFAEYKNICKELRATIDFTRILYKNATYTLHKLYLNNLGSYIMSPCGLCLLRRKISRASSIWGLTSEYSIFQKLVQEFNEHHAERLFLNASKVPKKRPISLLESKLVNALVYFEECAMEVCGVQVVVLHKGQSHVDFSFGTLSRFETIPTTKDTLFPLGLISTNVLAIAILHLVKKGALSLDDLVSKHWPEFGCNGKETITIRQVLNHTSGLIYVYARNPIYAYLMDYKGMVKSVEQATIYSQCQLPEAYHGLYFTAWIFSELIQRVTGICSEEYIMDMMIEAGADDKDICFPSLPVEVKKSKTSMRKAPVQDASVNGEMLNSKVDGRVVVVETGGAKCDDRKLKESLKPNNVHSQNYHSNLGKDANIAATVNHNGVVANQKESLDVDKDKGFDTVLAATKPGETPILNLDEISTSSARKSVRDTSQFIDVPLDDVPLVPVVASDADVSNSDAPANSSSNAQEQQKRQDGVPSKADEPKRNGLEDIQLFEKGEFEKLSPVSQADAASAASARTVSSQCDSSVCTPRRRYIRKLLDIKETVNDHQISGKVVNATSFSASTSPSDSDCQCDVSENVDSTMKRCLFITDKCPSENRFAKVFRRTTMMIFIGDAITGDADAAVDLRSKQGIVDDSICQPLENPRVPSPTLVYRSSIRKLQEQQQKVKSRPGVVGPQRVDFSNFDMMRFGAIILDPVNYNHKCFYKQSMPAANGKVTSMALATLFSKLGDIIGPSTLQEMKAFSHVDHLTTSRLMTSSYCTRLSLGLQKFLLRYEGEVIPAFGMADNGGPIVMHVPHLDLTISILVGHYGNHSVYHRLLTMIFRAYNLELIHAMAPENCSAMIGAVEFKGIY